MPRVAHGLVLVLLVGAAAPAVAQSQLSEVLVDVTEDAQPLRDVLGRLQRAHGLNYVVSQRAIDQAGPVTVHLRQVPLDVALQSICAACGLRMEVRGPVLVILPADLGAPRAPLPRVDEGLEAPRVPLPRPRPPAADEEGAAAEPLRGSSQAVGTLLEVDLEDRRLQLHVDGVKRDFFLPDPDQDDPFQQAARLRQALATLKPGERVALLYRPDPARPIVTNLIGGAHSGSASSPARHRRGARGPAPATPEVPPAPQPAPSPQSARTAPEPSPVLPSGALAGWYAGRDGDAVKVRRADDEVVVLHLPAAGGENRERRERMIAALDAMAEGDKLAVTYEQVDGKRVITNTVTQAGR